MFKGLTKISLIYHRLKPTFGRTFTSREVKEVRPTVGIDDANLQICVGIFYLGSPLCLVVSIRLKNSWKDVNQQKNNQTVNFRTILIQKFISP